jgi:ribonuclease HI
MRKFRKQHRSPLFQVAETLKDISMEDKETINPFTLAPWETRAQTATDGTATREPDSTRAAYIAVSSSARNGVVGLGGAIETRKRVGDAPTVETFSSTLGLRTEQNPYVGKLAAMAQALNQLPQRRYRSVTLLTRNKAAVLTIRNPRQQSGQEHICNIYKSIRKLKRENNKIMVTWLQPAQDDELWTRAKGKAKEATRQGSEPQMDSPRAKSTTLIVARAKGKLSKRIDTALPGRHTRKLYD